MLGWLILCGVRLNPQTPYFYFGLVNFTPRYKRPRLSLACTFDTKAYWWHLITAVTDRRRQRKQSICEWFICCIKYFWAKVFVNYFWSFWILWDARFFRSGNISNDDTIDIPADWFTPCACARCSELLIAQRNSVSFRHWGSHNVYILLASEFGFS